MIIAMHMADALVSPAVGLAMLTLSGALLLFACAKVRRNFRADSVALTGVMGAFVFAAQMINFAIPGTGSSGHIGGAVLLCAVLGAYPAFLAIACVLLIQALFFADGGLLALGCNIFNIGFFACFIAYPIIFKPIAGDFSSQRKVALASILACVVSLQLGAFCVVLETLCSGVTQLPFAAFAGLMQPIHLAIGLAEGALTAATLSFLYAARPRIFSAENPREGLGKGALISAILVAALAMASGLSLLASSSPDGLEWAMGHASKGEEISASTPAHEASAKVSEAIAIMPDYNLPDSETPQGAALAGLVGGAITLAALCAGFAALKALGARRKAA